MDLALLAQATPGFTGADLENLINEAALIAARQDAKEISMKQFDAAKDKVLMGSERKSMFMSENEKKNTAYHEAGHALVGLMTKGCDPVHKVTIIPRGHALGVTIMLPDEDRLTLTKTYAESVLLYAMGGRAAEELMFNMRTSGAGDDIQKATDIARKMVCQWGMSDKIGPRSIGKRGEEVFMGRGAGSGDFYSENVAQEIDEEIKRLVSDAYDRALKILKDNKEKLVALAEALLIKETLDASEMRRIMEGENVVSEEELKNYKARKENAKKWREEQVANLKDKKESSLEKKSSELVEEDGLDTSPPSVEKKA